MKLLSLLYKDLKEYKNSLIFFIAIYLIMPLCIGFLNGIMFEKLVNPDIKLPRINVAFIDMDKTSYSKGLKELLTREHLKDSISINEYNSLEEVEEKIKTNSIQAAIIVPKDFSNNLERGISSNIRFLKSSSPSFTVDILYDSINHYVQFSNTNFNNGIKITALPEKNKLSSKQVFAASMLAFTSLFIALTGASNFLKEKESMTLLRMNSIPVGFNTIYAEKLLLTFITSILQSTVYIILSSFMGISFSKNLLTLILIIILHGFALTGIAGFAMNLFSREKTLSSVFAAITMFMGVIGGSFIPSAYVAQSFENLSKFTLNYWIQNSYTKIMGGGNLNSLLINIIILLSLGLVGILLGFMLNKKNKSFA